MPPPTVIGTSTDSPQQANDTSYVHDGALPNENNSFAYEPWPEEFYDDFVEIAKQVSFVV